MKKDLWKGVLLSATGIFLVFKMVDYSYQASARMEALQANNHNLDFVQALFSTTGYAEDLYAALLSFVLSLMVLVLAAYCLVSYVRARRKSQRPYYTMAKRVSRVHLEGRN